MNTPPKPPPGLLRDFAGFLWQAKRWWIVPLLVAAAAIALLAWLTREPPRPPTYPHW